MAADHRLRRRQGPGHHQVRREAAYIAGDLAYYLDKRERGFDRVIIMLGADHHGYIGRMMAMCAAFGDTPGENLEILIGQLVNLVRTASRSGCPSAPGRSSRSTDLVDGVGVDAARYSLARSSADSPLDLDLDLLARATNENPVFYVQYAHARTANVSRNAAELGVGRADGFDPALLDHPSEAALLGLLGEFPRVVAQAAELREPHRVARYLEELAVGVPQVVRPLPRHSGGRRAGHRHPPHPAVAERRHQAGAGQRPRPAGRERAGADVTDAHVWPASAAVGADGAMTVGAVDLRTLAAEHGTPVYVLDEADLRARARAWREAFGRRLRAGRRDVYYAGKAFLSTAVARWVHAEGLRIDTATGGELAVALRAGVPG